MRTPTLLATLSLVLLAGACVGDAADSNSDSSSDPEDLGESQLADTWAPSPALVGRLQILGKLPDTERKIANAAYFKAASPGPSMSIALVLRDGPFYTQGFGTVGSGEPTADTAYYLASSTKVFTAAAMLRLLELNPSMHLDDPVGWYYEPVTNVTYPGPGKPANCPAPCTVAPMTLRHLITHASGLPNYGSPYPAGTDTGYPNRTQFDMMVSASSLEFYPGYNRDYSGVGIAVAGRVIENVSLRTYAQFMTEQLLAPLGMTRSSIDPSTLPAGTVLAQPYNDVSSPAGSGQDVGYLPITDAKLPLVTALAPTGHLITTAGDISKFLTMQLSASNPSPPSYPLTSADVTLSQHELIPNLAQQQPVAGDPRTVPACMQGGQFVACQECGAGWWYGNQSTELSPHGDATLGSWVIGAGSSGGYASTMYVAPDAGVASAVLTTANPDAGANPHNGFNGAAINTLTYEAASALNNPAVPWTTQPLPASLEKLMVLLNGTITTATLAQTFSPTFLYRNPSLSTNLGNLQGSLGTCSSFTVQRINSQYSATVTLQCATGSLPLTFSSTSASPYLVTNFTVLSSPVPAGTAGVPGGHAALALMGINGNAIPTAFANGDGRWHATSFNETTGDPWLQLDSRTAGTTAVPGDFDGDGRGDIAVTGGAGWNTIPVAFANADGTYRGTNNHVTSGLTTFPTYAATSGAKAIAGDFDGDGYGDIALTGANWTTVPVAFSNGDGTFRGTNLSVTGITFTQYAQLAGVKPVFGDFNGDGRGDIALVGNASWTQIPIAYSNGDGSFNAAWSNVSNTYFLYWSSLAGVTAVPGDFNGDGKWDIALTGGAGWSTIPLALSGAGGFNVTVQGETSGDTGFPVYATQSNARTVFGDFDGDGNFDIALTGGISWNTIPVAFSNGDGTFHGTNLGVVAGTTSFTSTAQTTALKPVGR